MSDVKIWKGNWTFILAAAGSAVGLGNIWKFPYMVGSNGGSAFVIVYLICILIIGLPVMASEILIGKYGRKSPINSLKKLSKDLNLNQKWYYLGVLGAIAGLLILSYYSVFAGMAFSYIFKIFPSGLEDPSNYSSNYFSSLSSSPLILIFWHSLFLLFTCLIVGFGVVKGIGRSVNILMPSISGINLFSICWRFEKYFKFFIFSEFFCFNTRGNIKRNGSGFLFIINWDGSNHGLWSLHARKTSYW